MYYLLLPNFFLFYWEFNPKYLALSILLNLFIFAILKTTKYLYIFLPLLYFIPAYLYYIYLYHVPLNEQILSIILETNTQETLSFLGEKAYLYILFNILWFFFVCFLCYENYKKPYIWSHRSRIWILILGIFYLVLSFIFNNKFDNTKNDDLEILNDFMVDDYNFFLQDLKQTYPVGLFVAGYDMMKEQRKINQAFDENKNFKFNAQRNLVSNSPEIYVLVIGETSRRENWQLNGYARATNPRLSQQMQLVNFSNMLSLVSATRSSIPMMLTRKPEQQVYKYTFPEKSVISAFKEVGFKTYWLSTQQKFGSFDTTSSVYAKEADEMLFLNKTNYNQAGEFDDVLLPALTKVLQQPQQKKFRWCFKKYAGVKQIRY
ncbi:sulfatase-like hydrolase/transferase [Acinetobacter lwoffii]|uniref:sulfatase-like hydrolase/transferase n=1 Tax=Acinetobacter lwoffii TaxID=28090 RepID=UPI003F8DE398